MFLSTKLSGIRSPHLPLPLMEINGITRAASLMDKQSTQYGNESSPNVLWLFCVLIRVNYQQGLPANCRRRQLPLITSLFHPFRFSDHRVGDGTILVGLRGHSQRIPLDLKLACPEVPRKHVIGVLGHGIDGLYYISFYLVGPGPCRKGSP